LSGTTLGVIKPIIEAGQRQGVFRQDIDINHVYLMIASLCYFYNSNRHTLTLTSWVKTWRIKASSRAGWRSSAIWWCAVC